jgi:hypothetical protein
MGGALGDHQAVVEQPRLLPIPCVALDGQPDNGAAGVHSESVCNVPDVRHGEWEVCFDF